MWFIDFWKNIIFSHNKNFATFFLLTVIVECSTESNNLGNGMHFNYLIFSNPPFDTFIPGNATTFQYYGTSRNIMSWIASRYNFIINFVPINETLNKEIGTHEAVFYQLINDKDIDGISCGFYITLDRKERMDFTSFIWVDDFGLVVPRAGEESRLFAFIRPFQPMVWLLIFVSIIAIVGSMTFLQWIYYRFSSYKSDTSAPIANSIEQNDLKPSTASRRLILDYLGAHILYVINIMTNQGCRERSDRHSFRILAGFWVLVGMVLVNSYSGIVISSLTVPKMKKSIESLEEWAASDEVGVLLRSDVSTGEQILMATSGVYKVIGDKARSKPDQIFADPFKLNAKLLTGNYGYPFLRTFCTSFVGRQYIKDGYCRFKVVNLPSFSTGYYSSLMKKGSPYANAFNKGILELWESGLTRYWVKGLLPKAEECYATKVPKVSNRQVPIRLRDLVSAFLILGIGIGLSTLFFLLEVVYTKFTHH